MAELRPRVGVRCPAQDREGPVDVPGPDGGRVTACDRLDRHSSHALEVGVPPGGQARRATVPDLLKRATAFSVEESGQ